MAEQSAKLTETLDLFRSAVNLNHGKHLDVLLQENYLLSKQLDNTIDRIQGGLRKGVQFPSISSNIDPYVDADSVLPNIRVPPSLTVETNQKLDDLLSIQVESAQLHQNLNQTTIEFLSDFRNEAKRTSRHALIFMILGFVTLLVAVGGTWLNFASSNNITEANQRLLESFADRLATTQSDLASQSAQDREALLLE